MWTRKQLKDNAKYVLGFSYWKALLACLIVSFLTGIGSSGSGSATSAVAGGQVFSNEIMIVIGVVVFLMVALSSLFAIFVAAPITVGGIRFFIANRQNKGKIDQIFSLFKNGVYLNVVKTMFLVNLKLVLWSLLFVIPGIIKSYEYQMVPYILAENPGIDSKRAFLISREMMKGEKWDTFVLELSFLGWALLGALMCGIGTLFLVPYMEATFTELYEVLKYKVISRGLVHPDELGGPNGYLGEDARPGYAQPQAQPVQHVSPPPAAPHPAQPPVYPESGETVPVKEEASWFEQQVQAEQEQLRKEDDPEDMN